MIHNNDYIPSQAYLYFPSEKDYKTKNTRHIFDGNTKFDAKETELIAEFRAYAQKHHYALKPLWTDSMIVRFLQANDFKMQKTLVSVKDHTLWRETQLPVPMDKKLEEFLNSGFLYVHGRDHKFRPIVVFNIYQMDPKTFDMEVVTRALTFWLEYIISDWMLPGQVENWIFICNIKGMGISSIAVSSVRKLFGYLQNNFKCRLHKMYLINASSGIYAPWQIAKRFLDGDTVEKVNFYKTQVPQDLFKTVHPDQVEEQFGGSAPNCTQYWPPKFGSANYFVSLEEEDRLLISKEEYQKKFQLGELQNMKINKAFTFGMGSSILKFTPKGEEEEEDGYENPSPLRVSGTTDYQQRPSLRSLFGETPYNRLEKQFKFEDFADNNKGEEETDYVEDMNENLRWGQEQRGVKSFEAYFL